MRVFVLGAGASAHAGYPLASALGTVLDDWVLDTTPGDHIYRDRFAELKRLYHSLENVEAVMTDLLECTAGSPASTLSSTVRPYLISDFHEAIRECFDTIRVRPASLYDRLAREHVRPGDTIVTFNYDLGVERSLQAAGHWDITDGYGFRLTDAAPSSAVAVLKLHGSTNWRALLFGGSTGYQAARDSLGWRPVLFFHPDLAYLGYPAFRDPLCAHLATAATLSAMILPSLKKTFYYETTFGKEWEPFWNHLWQRAATALAHADDIVLIGYSLPVADERARDLLLKRANKMARVTVCCGRASASIQALFRDHGFTNTATATTFEAWLAAWSQTPWMSTGNALRFLIK